jgi:hypothetical protein
MSTAIYGRVSTERQTAHVYAPGETLRSKEVFRDDGYSADTLNRPGLDRSGTASKKRRSSLSSSRARIASPVMMSSRRCCWKHSSGLVVGPSFWISLWGRIHKCLSCDKFAAPWPKMNAP